MKKYISFFLIVLAFSLNVNLSFADLSQSRQDAYRNQVNKMYSGFEAQIGKLSQVKQTEALNGLVAKINTLESKQLSERNKFIYGYLKSLIQTKLKQANTTTSNISVQGDDGDALKQALSELHKPNTSYVSHNVQYLDEWGTKCAGYDTYLNYGVACGVELEGNGLKVLKSKIEANYKKQVDSLKSAKIPAVYNGFAYDKGLIINPAGTKITVKAYVGREGGIEKLKKEATNFYSNSFSADSLIGNYTGIDKDLTTYTRYYASENGKNKLLSIDVIINKNDSVSIIEKYENKSIIRFIVNSSIQNTLHGGEMRGVYFGFDAKQAYSSSNYIQGKEFIQKNFDFYRAY